MTHQSMEWRCVTWRERSGPRESESESDSSGEEVQNPLVEDHEQLHLCISQLKDILGDDNVSREELERLSRAADFDVNRALNFFFAS